MLTGILVFLGLNAAAGASNLGEVSSAGFVAILLLFFAVTFLLAFSHWLIFMMAIDNKQGQSKKKKID